LSLLFVVEEDFVNRKGKCICIHKEGQVFLKNNQKVFLKPLAIIPKMKYTYINANVCAQK